jgi:hypothetical protein
MRHTEVERVDVHLVFDPSEAALAEAIQYRLAENGLTCDNIPSEVVPGEDFGDYVRRTLGSSRSYVFLMSPASVRQHTVLAEAGAAWAVTLPVFLLLNQVKPSNYSPFFKRFPMFRLWSGFPRLVKTLQKLPERVPA